MESAFQEMKSLGANVVRIHLQFGTFMESPTKPRQSSLDQLARLVKLAEETDRDNEEKKIRREELHLAEAIVTPGSIDWRIISTSSVIRKVTS